MIDWEKPIQTRDGWKARVLCTDLRCAESDGYPAVVAVLEPNGFRESVWHIRADGSVGHAVSGNDIINVPTPPVVRYVYMVRGVRDGVIFVVSPIEQCDALIEDNGRNLIIAKHTLTEGDGIGGTP